MAKRLVDDTIITTDDGSSRIHYEITPTLRLRSHDSYNVVLECYKDSKNPTTGKVVKAWIFEGYYSNANTMEANLRVYFCLKNARWKKAWDEQPLIEAMYMRSERIADAYPVVHGNKQAVENFIKEAKEHEYKKSSEKRSKASKASKDENGQGSVGELERDT